MWVFLLRTWGAKEHEFHRCQKHVAHFLVSIAFFIFPRSTSALEFRSAELCLLPHTLAHPKQMIPSSNTAEKENFTGLGLPIYMGWTWNPYLPVFGKFNLYFFFTHVISSIANKSERSVRSYYVVRASRRDTMGLLWICIKYGTARHVKDWRPHDMAMTTPSTTQKWFSLIFKGISRCIELPCQCSLRFSPGTVSLALV